MNATQALAKLRKLLGSKAAIQDHKRPSSPELREQQARERRDALVARKATLEALEARKSELLAADDTYQRLKVAHEQAVKRHDACPYPAFRYSAGRVGGLFFSVAAEADSLAELVEKVEANKFPSQ